uniref:Muscarinic acetylcholine receptor n=1 Tax=Pelusios castaneus TaxID=367368 RepID=A0A8C8VDN3_9SAUR
RGAAPRADRLGAFGAAAGGFSAGLAVLLAALMGLLALATVLGNALVVLAFAVDRNLHTQGNLFFLSLALADLLVGGFCIPLYIPYVLTGEWRLGKGLCKLWLVVDYLVCTASVFNIVLISFDRFSSVTNAVSYRAQKGMTKNAVFKMIIVWVAAFLLYGPAIISWERLIALLREESNRRKRCRLRGNKSLILIFLLCQVKSTNTESAIMSLGITEKYKNTGSDYI